MDLAGSLTVYTSGRHRQPSAYGTHVDGILGENVARNLRLNYRYHPKFEPWSSDEARLFLRSIRTHWLGALFSAGLLLGLRRGEALGLSWSDVDLDRGVLQVRQALRALEGSSVLVRSSPTVPLDLWRFLRPV